jgi:SAM-dependent methyltransferase
MKKTIKIVYRYLIKKPYLVICLSFNKLGRRKQCYICNKTFNSFIKFGKGSKGLNAYSKYLNNVGSDADNFWCQYCRSTDRERHLFMYFDKLALWDRIANKRILHFAPEDNLKKKIATLNPLEYIMADLYPKDETQQKIDITQIPYDDNKFDFLICNHVLEHVTEISKAIKEISRVLKPGGIGILQTPYSELLYNHFEDPGINTNELRRFFYAQEDHLRVVSKRQLFNELAQFFTLNIIENQSLFNNEECLKYGINRREDLIMVLNKKQDKICC